VYKYKAGDKCIRCGGAFNDKKKAPAKAEGSAGAGTGKGKEGGRGKEGKEGVHGKDAKTAGEGESSGNEGMALQLKHALSAIKLLLEKRHAEQGGSGQLGQDVMDGLDGVLHEAFGIPGEDSKDEPKAPKGRRWKAARERLVKANNAEAALDKKLQSAETDEKESFLKHEKNKKETNRIRKDREAAKVEQADAKAALEAVSQEPDDEEEDAQGPMELEKIKLGSILAVVGLPPGGPSSSDALGAGAGGNAPMESPVPTFGPAGGRGKGNGAAPGPYTKPEAAGKPSDELTPEDIEMAISTAAKGPMGAETAKKFREFQELLEAEQIEAKRRRMGHPTEAEVEAAQRQADEGAKKAAEEEQRRSAAEAEEKAKAEAEAAAAADVAK